LLRIAAEGGEWVKKSNLDWKGHVWYNIMGDSVGYWRERAKRKPPGRNLGAVAG